jgi:uncharacterized protein (DUF2236 family)
MLVSKAGPHPAPVSLASLVEQYLLGRSEGMTPPQLAAFVDGWVAALSVMRAAAEGRAALEPVVDAALASPVTRSGSFAAAGDAGAAHATGVDGAPGVTTVRAWLLELLDEVAAAQGRVLDDGT